MFCTQLDWSSAGTKLSGKCLVHPLPYRAMAHTTHFRKLSPRDKLQALKFEILEDSQKVVYLHVFQGEEEN